MKQGRNEERGIERGKRPRGRGDESEMRGRFMNWMVDRIRGDGNELVIPCL
jgi:hypothetical protein